MLDDTFNIVDLEVGGDGRLYVADKSQAQIRIFDANGDLLHAVGRKGRGPGEFQEPRAVALHQSEQIFAVRDNDGRVSLFSRDGIYQQSFIVPGILPSGSSSMTFVRDSLLAIGGFKPESMYDGDVIHLYTTDGELVSSFVGRTKKAKSLNVTVTVGVGFDLYRNRLYTIQPVDYAISVYALDGERIETIRVSPLPDHFRPPSSPQPNPMEDQGGAIQWARDSDALRQLFVVSETLLLVTVQKRNGKDISYRMDIINRNEGRVVHSRPVEGWVVNADSERGWVYVANAQEGAPTTSLKAYRVEDWLE